MKKILIVDDDHVMRESLATVLEAEGYKVSRAADGREGLAKALEGGYDLISLDLVMPELGGVEVCRKLREAGVQTPIIMLTGKKKEEVDKVLGLELGADDYMIKPFGTSEFVARVHAVLRRGEPRPAAPEEFSFDGVRLNFKKKTASKAGKVVHLTAKEFGLLGLLISHAGEVVTREKILNEVWEYDRFPTTRTIDTFMHNLRKKIEDDPANPVHLITVPWSGYKFQK
ncbi:MAG: response regulator transcription factor [Candidatus Aminicenantales bacterium]|jgi:DNA-binding response OmpR family regulator